MTLPLEGYRIIDFTQVWAGPQLGAALGDTGAEVVRVESRAR
ncbi:MAG: CoA transferase, partial [Chloroflexi bacterium]|nr:CoA transferase [Chloroflexota bacterium]